MGIPVIRAWRHRLVDSAQRRLWIGSFHVARDQGAHPQLHDIGRLTGPGLRRARGAAMTEPGRLSIAVARGRSLSVSEDGKGTIWHISLSIRQCLLVYPSAPTVRGDRDTSTRVADGYSLSRYLVQQ